MRSCGKPLSNAEIKVVGEDGVELPPGQVGEIVVRTPAGHEGVLAAAGGDGRERFATAGSTPGTPATSTRTATSTSTTG